MHKGDAPVETHSTKTIIGPDTNKNVVHYVYPEGRTPTAEELNPYIGGWFKKCRHIYEYVNAEICPDCGRDTHEADFETTAKIIRQHYINGNDKPYICDICNGTIRIWWSI
jgi:hypothetical protein